jgi:hypothetical protein
VQFLDDSRSELVLTVVAVILMLGGAAILIAGVGAGVGFSLVAVGIALTAVLATNRRRHHGSAH